LSGDYDAGGKALELKLYIDGALLIGGEVQNEVA